MKMRTGKQQLLVEIMEGECQECGMIGPLISGESTQLCEMCTAEID